MAVELVMPRLSESMEEGTIVSWLVPDGAQVHQGEEIAEIETDKATLPYEAPESGVLRVLVPEGTTLALGQPIGLIDDLVPLPGGGQSVAPPGAPAPAAAQSPDAGWSPAWGPQPARAAPQPPSDGEDEGATTEFAALDLPEPAPRPPAAPTVRREAPVPFAPPSPAAAAEPTQTTPAAEGAPIAPAPARDAAPGSDPQLFVDVTPDQAAADAAASDDALEPALAAMPWVDTRFSTKPDPAAAPAPAKAPEPADDAAPTPAAAADERRFTPDELIAPPTLPPRPPALQPTSSGNARVAASPVARRLARELGIDLATIEGTGPEGRVVRADIDAAQALGAARPPRQAAATPHVASEFTPPVDESRSATPIPAAIPADDEAPAPEAKAAAPAEAAEPQAAVEATAVPSQPGEVTDPAAEALVEAAQRAAAELIRSPDAVVSPPVASVDDDAPSALTEVPPVDEAAPAGATAPAGADQPDAPEPVEAVASEPEVVEAPVPPVAPAPAAADTAAADTAAAPAAPQADPPATDPDASDLTVESDIEPTPTPATDGAHAGQGSDAVPAEATAEAPAAAAPATEARVLPAAQPGRGKGEPEIIELTRQQQTVARRMAESKATIPDFDTVVEVDAAPMLALRAELTATRPDLAAPSVNDLLVKATAVALRAFPAFNGAYRDGRLERYPRVNVGIAVDASGTLLVPVVHDADTLSVSQIAARTNELLAKAQEGGLRPPDIASATFTVSNLGTHGVDRFTAVITPGQAGILTVGAIAARPVVRDGAVVAGQTLVLTLTTDHRAIYGVEAAAFLGRLRQLLEHPTSLLA